MLLYHGSNEEVSKPELRPLTRAVDFGRAFYLTTDREQAIKWAKTTTLRRAEGEPIVSIFEIEDRKFTELNRLVFTSPDSDWLRYISHNRNLGIDDSSADVVMGPVANDNTMPVLNLYFKGAYTEEEALRRLLPQKLRDQVAFKSERALSHLTFIGSEKV